MSIMIIITVIIGISLGYFIMPEIILEYINYIIDIGLCLLLFFIGIEIGVNKEIVNKIKNMGLKILLVPIMIIIGSIVGSMIAGLFLGLPINESSAIGAGFGWYTLSSMILADYSCEVSTLAFISNVTRELFAFMIIPLVAKYIGDIESIAPAGATAMDTSLPLISKETNPKTAVIAFITGVILSISVPFLVPIFINLK